VSSEQPPAPPAKPKRPPRTKLNDREQAFADAYRGNKTQAAIEAGYSAKSAPTIGSRLYKKVQVQAEIRRQQLERQSAAVMDRDEMQRLFSSTARDVHLPIRERVNAAVWLGKTRGDFSTKLELKGNLTVHDLARAAMEPEPEPE
jgi:phage terminase small subunit